MQIYTRDITLIPYSRTVKVVFTDDLNAARLSFNIQPHSKKNWNNMYAGIAYIDYGGRKRDKFNMYLFINMAKQTTIPYMLDTISHEIAHIVDYTFQDAGIDTDYNNNEPYAYLTGYITGQVWHLYMECQSPTFCTKEGYIEVKPPQVEEKTKE